MVMHPAPRGTPRGILPTQVSRSLKYLRTYVLTYLSTPPIGGLLNASLRLTLRLTLVAGILAVLLLWVVFTPVRIIARLILDRRVRHD